jgi:hypothetical protein
MDLPYFNGDLSFNTQPVAIQSSVIPLSGKLGKLVFYQLNGKEVVRSLPQPYELTVNSRNAGKDFGKASAAASRLLQAISAAGSGVADNQLYHRLNSCLIKVIGTAHNRPTGEREIADGDLSLLKGLQLNRHRTTHTVFPVAMGATIHPAGEICIRFAGFRWPARKSLRARAGSLLVQVCCFACDFQAKDITVTRFDQLIGLGDPLPAGSMYNFFAENMEGRVAIIAAGFHYLDKAGKPIADRTWRAGSIIEAALVQEGRIIPFRVS